MCGKLKLFSARHMLLRQTISMKFLTCIKQLNNTNLSIFIRGTDKKRIIVNLMTLTVSSTISKSNFFQKCTVGKLILPASQTKKKKKK